MTILKDTIVISDRNESKYLVATGLNAIPSPRNSETLDFKFDASPELSKARLAYATNQLVPVLSFIGASRFIDGTIHDFRQSRKGLV
jgi:hypothetical protein